MTLVTFLLIAALITIYHIQGYLKELIVVEYTLERQKEASIETMLQMFETDDDFDSDMKTVPGLIHPN